MQSQISNINLPLKKMEIPGKQAGFTLVELIVVFSIMVLISSLGLAGFVNFSREQTLKSTAQDIKSMLISARAYSLSQLNSCGNHQFSGYSVYFCNTNNVQCGSCRGIYPNGDQERYYELDILCDGVPDANNPKQYKKLPANVTVNASTCKSYTFEPITSAVVASDGNQSISVSYDNTSYSQTITVTPQGVIK